MAKYTSVSYLHYKYTSLIGLLCITTIQSKSIIDIKSGLSINHKNIKIDWDNYQNKMLIIKNGDLKMLTINRDFS